MMFWFSAWPRVRLWLFDLALVGAAVALIVIAATWLARPQLIVRAGDDDARRYLGGFWAKEQNPTDTFRWSQPDAQLRLFGFEQRGPVLVRMRLSASRPLDQPLVQVTLANTTPALRLVLEREWREYTLLLPAPPHDAEGRLLALHSLVDPPYAESRPLGFALSSITVSAHPLGLADRLPDAGRLLFLVLLGLAIFVALRRRLSRARSFALVLALALGLGVWMAALPIVAGYWLPNLWLALGLAWVVLLAPPLLRALRPRLQAHPQLGLGAGLLALGLAQALLPFQQAWSGALGWSLMLAGGLLLAAVFPAGAPRADPLLPRGTVAVALALITLAALALRLAGLDQLPPGMWRDEARHGLLALRILNDPSYRPVYVPTVADIPALLFYLAAVPIALFGPEPWVVRLVPALAGALTPLLLFFMARPLFGARAALLASALLAVSVWHISLSRLAFAATLGPPLTLLALGGVWRAIHAANRQARLGWAALAGTATGVAVYTYHPSRLTPVLVALAAVLLLRADLGAWRRMLPAMLGAALLTALVALPLAWYALDNRAGFGRRLGQTSVFTPDSLEIHAPIARVEQNLRLHLGIWNERGDRIGRHNLPNAPLLDPLTGVLFAGGVALALLWWRDRRVLLLLVWLGFTLVPGMFSIEAPHAVRTVEAIAPSMLLAGLAADSLLLRAKRARLAWAALTAGVLALLLLNGTRYFVIWPSRNQVYEQFYVADTHIGLLAQRLARDPALSQAGYQLFIPTGPGDAAVLNYLVYGLPVGRFDGQALSAPPGSRAILIDYGELPPAAIERAASSLGPAARRLGQGPTSPLTGQPEYIVYGVGEEAAAALGRALGSP